MEIQPIYLPTTIANPIEQPYLPELPSIGEPSTAPIKAPGITRVARKRIVLVSGLNYPHYRGKISDGFGEYCKRIAPRLRKKYPDAIIRFFSFYDGKQYEMNFDAKGNLGTLTVIKDYGTLNRENYRYVIKKKPDSDSILTIKPPKEDATTLYFPGISDISKTKDITKKDYLAAFYDGTLKERSISIKHPFEYIAGLANYAPKTLAEFHIFSHAYGAGPILVNSSRFYDEAGDLIDDRKYLDKDARTDDFQGYQIVNMFDFSDAFAGNGFSMLWGCLGSHVTRDIIDQIRKSEFYKSGEALKDRSKPFIKLKYQPEWGSDYIEDDLHDNFNDSKPFPNGETQEKSLDDIATAFKDNIIPLTYARILADYSGKNVLSALPGTAANFDNEKTQKQFGLSLMHVFMGEKYGDFWIDEKTGKKVISDFRPQMQFYKDVLGYKFDWEYDEYDKVYKRGYAVYEG